VLHASSKKEQRIFAGVTLLLMEHMERKKPEVRIFEGIEASFLHVAEQTMEAIRVFDKAAGQS
jgi:hypothetical protein